MAGIVIGGVVVIASIGFAGSYAAVQDLAVRKGFGAFAHVFPIGVDAGILVLLALDLLLTWLRMPFPLLRHTAWLLTGATIAFNGAVAWPDPLGVGMHAVIPLLFVVAVEAARHAVGRIADITADRHIEPVRLIRWLLSPIPTFVLWRRMKLWELRSYEQVIKLEQERLVYKAGLYSRFGRAWRRKAPIQERLPLRLVKYGVPLNHRQDPTASVQPARPDGALETHVTEALAITSARHDDVRGSVAASGPSVNGAADREQATVNLPAGASVDPVHAFTGDTVNGAADREQATVNPPAGASVNPVHAFTGDTVNGAADREQATVNPPAGASVNPVHAFTGDTVNGSWKDASRFAVNRVGVNDAHAVNTVNSQVVAGVNGFTPTVKRPEFTRESGSVNRADWTVKRLFTLGVNDSTGREPVNVNGSKPTVNRHEFTRESGSVNGPRDTVNGHPDETVKGHLDRREEPAVNRGATGVNDDAVKARRGQRPQPAASRGRESVHAAVGAPNRFAVERAKRAAEWFAAKDANPALTQKVFAQQLGKSEAWLSKAINEALESEGGAADG
ncbi:DUF2637 domain-containing protein (plasmid) [Streptomyces sp. NBC_01601]|nr:DUF2637 domain-containing protein [Streptomyces sp. NBC_01601]